jgi:capsular polysaccharide biosynthesis protein
MQLRRVIKTLVARWPVIVVLAIVGASVGAIVASNYNKSITPRFRANAPITFFQLAEDDADSESTNSARTNSSTTSSATDAEAERIRAGLLLEETLAANPRLTIQVDKETNTLLFIAVGSDSTETLNSAVALRSEYQSKVATVLNVDEIKATMASTLEEIDHLRGQISDLQVTEPAAEDPQITAQRTTLEAQITELAQRQAQIEIWLDNPELRPTETDFYGQDSASSSRITGEETTRSSETDTTSATTSDDEPIITAEALAEEHSRNELILARLESEFSTVPDPPVAEELSSQDSLRLAAIQLDLEDLEAEYVDLVRGLDGRSPGAFPEEPTFTDETKTARSTPLSGFLGMIVGALVAGMAIAGHDQVRKPVWAASDLGNVVSLALVNRKRETDDEHQIWYPTALTQRRRDIQTLRSATDSITNEQPTVLGLFGVGVSREEVGELAADLAVSYSVGDRNILLIDGSSFHPNIIPEFGDGHNTLNDVLMTQAIPEDAAARINTFLDHAIPSAPRLTAVHVNADLHDPIDVFAAPNARIFVEVALHRYDMVVIAGPDIYDPLADAVMRRTELVALVGYVGVTAKSAIENAVGAINDRRAEVAGAVLLEGRRIPVNEQVRTYLRGSRDTAQTAPEDDLGIEIDLDATAEDAPTLPSPASSPSGLGKNSRARVEGERLHDDEVEETAASVLDTAKARRANSQSN